MEFLYFLWALLPITLFLFALKGAAKKVAKAQGREFPKDFFKQALFCAGILAVAIWIDKSFFNSMMEAISFEEADPRIFRWLLYPALLGAAASIQQIFVNRRHQREREAMRERQLKFTNQR